MLRKKDFQLICGRFPDLKPQTSNLERLQPLESDRRTDLTDANLSVLEKGYELPVRREANESHAEFSAFRPPDRPASSAHQQAWRSRAVAAAALRAAMGESDDDDDDDEDEDDEDDAELDDDARDASEALADDTVQTAVDRVSGLCGELTLYTANILSVRGPVLATPQQQSLRSVICTALHRYLLKRRRSQAEKLLQRVRVELSRRRIETTAAR